MDTMGRSFEAAGEVMQHFMDVLSEELELGYLRGRPHEQVTQETRQGLLRLEKGILQKRIAGPLGAPRAPPPSLSIIIIIIIIGTVVVIIVVIVIIILYYHYCCYNCCYCYYYIISSLLSSFCQPRSRWLPDGTWTHHRSSAIELSKLGFRV